MARPMQCDTYVDGVQVKIAEAYKPPRKLTLPAVYNNKSADLLNSTYDFEMDRTILGKVINNTSINQIFYYFTKLFIN